MWPILSLSITSFGSTASLSEHVQLQEKCRINIKFLEKKSATKKFQMLTEAYEDDILSRAHVFEWYKWFSGERVNVEDDEPAGSTKKKKARIGGLLHQDKAPAHTVLFVKQFLTSKSITVMGHPPYSTDLTGESPEGPSKNLVPEL
ncbi:hypothetical protein TNCV_2752561 [Trichonephila clavipes]|nr:hypothetical protein TNCV_2752561 [Trichonephila clavipes]